MTWAVFLAAGHSKRFGSNKLLYELEGRPLAARAFSLLPDGMPGLAVTGSDAVAVLAEQAGLAVVRCPAETDDVALSIRLGVESLPPDCEGAMFLVCDQPYLRAESVSHLVDCFRRQKDKIWILSHGGRRGNPCVFPREFFGELTSLPYDTAGKYVIRRHPERLDFCEAEDGRELEDLDTPPEK